MTHVTLCDLCGKATGSSYKKLGLLDGNNSVHRTFDFHDKCYSALTSWLTQQRINSSKFKDPEEIRAGK